MDRGIKITITIGALGLALVRIFKPEVKIDEITLGLLVLSVVPWAAAFLESFKVAGTEAVYRKKVDDLIDISSESDSTSETQSLSDQEKSVLKALTTANVPLRSEAGISRDASVDIDQVKECLLALSKKGLATAVDGKKGVHWGITSDGKRHLT